MGGCLQSPRRPTCGVSRLLAGLAFQRNAVASTDLVSVVTGLFLLFIDLFCYRALVTNLAATILLLAWLLPSARLENDYHVHLLPSSTWAASAVTYGGQEGGSRRHVEGPALASFPVPSPKLALV